MEYQVGCLADMISEASGKKKTKSNKKPVAPKIKFEKLESQQVESTVVSNKNQGHEPEKSPKKRIRFSEAIVLHSSVDKIGSTTGSHQIENEVVKSKTKKITYEAEKRTVFVGNVSNKCKKQDLKRIFAPYGYIETIRFRSLSVANPAMSKKVAMIKKQLHPNRSNMNAYIKFRDEESAHKALERNGEILNNHTLRVDLALNNQNHNSKACVFIGNLKFLIQEEDLRKVFKDCGEICNVRIVRDKATGMGKGIAFVEFKNSASVELALQLDGEDLMGRCIRVSRLKGEDKGLTKGKKKRRHRSRPKPEEKQTKKEKADTKQQSLNTSGFNGTQVGNKNKKVNAKQRGSQEQNKSMLSQHSPKGGVANKRNKVSMGANSKKINVTEQGKHPKNKSKPISSQFQGEKTGLKKIRKKKKLNKGELKKKVMLSKLEIVPKAKKNNVPKSKKNKTATQK